MKRSDVYREAARRVAEGEEEFSCVAVILAGPGAITNYEALMRPDGHWGAWGSGWGDPNAYVKTYATIHDCRVLALCFMAAIAEYEEKHGTSR